MIECVYLKKKKECSQLPINVLFISNYFQLLNLLKVLLKMLFFIWQYNVIYFAEIYSKVSQNACVVAKPAVIHFGGFEVDKKHVQSLSIVNASTEVIRMHIIPPQTKYFYVKYQKTVW